MITEITLKINRGHTFIVWGKKRYYMKYMVYMLFGSKEKKLIY